MEQDDSVSKTTLIALVIGAVIATVFILELSGKIQHNSDKEAFPLADYRVVLLTPGEEHRLSTKPAQQYAYCDRGFLFIQSETDQQLRGPMVDFKNRGIPCVQLEEQQDRSHLPSCSLPWFLRPEYCH